MRAAGARLCVVPGPALCAGGHAYPLDGCEALGRALAAADEAPVAGLDDSPAAKLLLDMLVTDGILFYARKDAPEEAFDGLSCAAFKLGQLATGQQARRIAAFEAGRAASEGEGGQ